MLPPASSKRSKNSRSLGAMTLEKRTAGQASRASGHSGVDTGGLDAACRQLARRAQALADRSRARPVVVPHAPVLDLPVRVEKPIGGPRVAVEGHPHAAEIHELDPVARGAAEREVGVPEHQALGAHSGEQLALVFGGFWEEAP